MAAKETQDLQLLEDDDDFEEFPKEGFRILIFNTHLNPLFLFFSVLSVLITEWDATEEAGKDGELWEDNWDDDNLDDDFSKQLR